MIERFCFLRRNKKKTGNKVELKWNYRAMGKKEEEVKIGSDAAHIAKCLITSKSNVKVEHKNKKKKKKVEELTFW